MASDLTEEQRKEFEEMLAKAEPYPEDSDVLYVLDGPMDPDRALATLAKRALEGTLR